MELLRDVYMLMLTQQQRFGDIVHDFKKILILTIGLKSLYPLTFEPPSKSRYRPPRLSKSNAYPSHILLNNAHNTTMGALRPSATIIIVLVCCACLVVMIAAIGRHYHGETNDEEAEYTISPEQVEYMRGVQQRNVEAILPRNHGRGTEGYEKTRIKSSMTNPFGY